MKLKSFLLHCMFFDTLHADVSVLIGHGGGKIAGKFFKYYVMGDDGNLTGKIDNDLTRRIDFYDIIELCVNNTVNGLGESLLKSHL